MPKNEINLGTTLIVCLFQKGIMIVTDSQTSSGALKSNKVADKINILSNFITCCRSGSAADTQNILEHLRIQIFQYLLEWKSPLKVRSVAQMLQNLIKNEKKKMIFGFICAGWDSFHGGQIYSITQGGCLLNQVLALAGSGSMFIQGFCDSNFNLFMGYNESKNFLIKALSLSMNRDGYTGGAIRFVCITKFGIKREFFNSTSQILNIYKRKKVLTISI
jgi:20S proteasome subunit beta 1